MADVFKADKRREIMQHVKTRNTAPEVKLRSLLHRRGFRFRVNRHDLPGKLSCKQFLSISSIMRVTGSRKVKQVIDALC